jgi:acetyl-CoA synthetase
MLIGNSYDEIKDNFQWDIPKYYNIGVDVCDKWASKEKRIALIYVNNDEKEHQYTYKELKIFSNQFANTLRYYGANIGDRIGILLPQCPETLISHIAIYKLGCVALPLLTLFGTMAIEYRLKDSRAKILITNKENLFKIQKIRDNLPNLKTIIIIEKSDDKNVISFWDRLLKGKKEFNPVKTNHFDPALIIYTSGTTGQPKGTLHGHKLLLGIMPGFEFYHNLFPKKGDLVYTPLDWAYIGGSFDTLFPTLHHGMPILAFRPPKFDPEKALYMIEKYNVRNLMVVPSVLRIIKNSIKDIKSKYNIKLRSVTAGGETLGEDLNDWSKEVFGTAINEQYGQTECDLIVGFCCKIMPIVKGSIGKVVPGHCVEILDKNGEIAKNNEIGEICVKKPDPVMFIEYFNKPEATTEKFLGEWMKTGDLGRKDETEHFWYTGRADDLIESGGYRIGPGEIEECLMKHEAVDLVCVIGAPDPIRGQIVKAYIVPKKGYAPNQLLEESIRNHVKGKLEAFAYPRSIKFLKKMPMTKTGKILKSALSEEK